MPWVFHDILCEEDIPICQTNFEGGSVQNMVLFNEAVVMNLEYAEVILCSSVVVMQFSCIKHVFQTNLDSTT